MSGWETTLSGLLLGAVLLVLAAMIALRVSGALLSASSDPLERVTVAGLIGVTGWVGLLQILGLLGILWLPIVLGCLAAGALAAVRLLPAPAMAIPRPSNVPWGLVAAAVPFLVLAVLAVASVLPTQYFADSLRYHIPNAAYILDTGSLRSLPFAQPGDGSAAAPGNGSLLLLAVMLPFHNDALVGLVDLCCACLLVALCAMLLRELGRSAWVGAAAGLVVVTCWAFFGTEVGSAYDDGIGLLGLVAALTLGLRYVRTSELRWLVVSGMGVGLAMGSKADEVLPALAVMAGVILAGRLWRRPRHLGWLVAGALGLSAIWYARDWILAGDPFFPETVRLGSTLLFSGLGGSPSIATGPAHLSLLGSILHGGGTSAIAWFGALLASFGLCAVALLVTLPLAVARGGPARLIFGIAVACTVAYVVTPFTGSTQNVLGAMRYLLPGVAFAVLGLAAALPGRWLPVAASAALVVSGVEVGVFEIGIHLPITTLVAAGAASVVIMALVQARRRVALAWRGRWLRSAALAIAVAAAVLAIAHLQPPSGPSVVDRALAVSRDPAGRVVVMDVDDVTAITGADLDIDIVAAGDGPQGAETVIGDPAQLTARIDALHPAAVVVGHSGLVNSIPAGWQPPAGWTRVGMEAGAVVYRP
jgi:hypothetical protein